MQRQLFDCKTPSTHSQDQILTGMGILLLGATGRIGMEVLTQALDQSIPVVALVRRPEALVEHKDKKGLIICKGLPVLTDIDKALKMASEPVVAIISTLNNGRTSDWPWAKPVAPTNLLADSTTAVIDVMKTQPRCRKYVRLSSIGVGSSRAHAGFLLNFVVDHSNMKIAFDDHLEAEKLVLAEHARNAAFKFVEVRPTFFKGGPKAEVKTCAEDGKGASYSITRASVGGFMLDAALQETWDCQSLVIGSK